MLRRILTSGSFAATNMLEREEQAMEGKNRKIKAT
jgi:hypothetical protein